MNQLNAMPVSSWILKRELTGVLDVNEVPRPKSYGPTVERSK